MPTYEMPLLLRIMKKPETAVVLKRVANTIFKTGGFIRKIENWGEKSLPCKASAHGKIYKQASYFLFCFDVPPSSVKDIHNEYGRDIDVIRANIYKKNPPPKENVCTLEDDLLPPPYRPSVLKLLEATKKKKKGKTFAYNSGLDYYPFLK